MKNLVFTLKDSKSNEYHEIGVDSIYELVELINKGEVKPEWEYAGMGHSLFADLTLGDVIYGDEG